MSVLERGDDGRIKVSPALRVAARRVFKQVALFVVARLPTGGRDDRPFKERVWALFHALGEEIAIQWERWRQVPVRIWRGGRRAARMARQQLRGIIRE